MSTRRSGPPSRFDGLQARITRGALVLLFLQAGVSVIWLLSDVSVRATLLEAMAPTADAVWRQGRVWTLVTGPVLEPSFASLLFQALVLWTFVPTLERWWGTRRFLVFAASTSVAATVAATLLGLVTGAEVPVLGYDPMVYGAVVAFGILYARQPVQFFGVLPMTGRQLMYGILGFVGLFVVLGRQWELAAGYAAATGLAALLASGRWNPRLWWYRLRHRRARAGLQVLDGGRHPTRARRDSDDGDRPWLN